ncbi:MAG: hypothetical protein K0S65_3356, partial [Labilithrix sp.]|nr:hypothetical protein [Labilithrix sp.]
VCANGTPSNTPVTNGTACNGAAACFNGTCGGCGVATDCPGTDNDCRARTCSNNQCGASFTAAGTPTAAQQTGDCHEVRCDGAGNTVNAVHDADVPSDGKQCTTDVCTNGEVSNPNVAYGTACNENGGSFCDNAGMCVAPGCNDKVQNGSETGIDCGGSCPPCGPDVTAVVPADTATNVAVASAIELTFASAISPATLTTQQNAGACSGSIQVSSDDFATCIGLAAPVIEPGETDVTVTPASALAYGTTYKVKVTTDAKKANGADITPYTMPAGFTTAVPPCTGSAVVISQVFGGGGNTGGGGAPFRNDFVELYNRGTVEVSLAGWSVQYASKSGTFDAKVDLSKSIAPGGYYLVHMASGGDAGALLPAADASGSITVSSSDGKVALVRSTTPVAACNAPTVVDLVGFGTGNCWEGTGATRAISNTTAAIRKGAGCTDTNSNTADFDVATPTPRNSAAATAACGCSF